MCGSDGIEFAEELALAVEILGDGLDDEVDLGQCIELGAHADATEECGALRLVELAATHGSLGGRLDRLERLRGPHVVELNGDDIEPVSCDHLGDARPHRA